MIKVLCICKRKEVSQMGKYSNKWTRAAIPALLLHCSIGTVYCWSIFSQEIADYIGFSKGATEWAFSFAIFFLGMSAAFLGGIVEKDIHKSSLIATICFTLGMVGTGFFIWYGGTHQGLAQQAELGRGRRAPCRSAHARRPPRPSGGRRCAAPRTWSCAAGDRRG